MELVSLLRALGQSVKDARELGRKFAVIESGKNSQKRFESGRIMDQLAFADSGENTLPPMQGDFLP